MFDRVTITYRGARYEIGRGSGFYGVWTAGGARSQPLERWPEALTRGPDDVKVVVDLRA